MNAAEHLDRAKAEMARGPIFDQIVREQRFSPFSDLVWPDPAWWAFPTACPICGKIDASQFLVPQYDDPICIECWQCNRHHEPESWHCFDCDKFLSGFDRMVLLHQDVALFLCREHFEWRIEHAS